MNKMLRPKGSRSPISIREFILLVGLVFASVSWYKEYERSRGLNEQLESASHMFNGMLETEAKLRKNPEAKSARLRFMEFGGPKPALQWSMEVNVIDEGQAKAGEESPPPATPPSSESTTPASKGPPPAAESAK